MSKMHKKALSEFQKMLVVIVAAMVGAGIFLRVDTTKKVTRNAMKVTV